VVDSAQQIIGGTPIYADTPSLLFRSDCICSTSFAMISDLFSYVLIVCTFLYTFIKHLYVLLQGAKMAMIGVCTCGTHDH